MKQKLKAALYLTIGFISLSALTLSEVKAQGFGIRAGVNFQNMTGKDDDGDKLDNKLSTKFSAGLNYEIPIATDYFVQPGVMYYMKGAKIEGDSVVNLSYVEIPVNFLYKPMLGAGNMLLGFGPYVGFGIGGKIKPESGNDIDIEFGNSIDPLDPPTFRRMDAGANLMAGYEFSNKFSFQINAQLGLVNIAPEVNGSSSQASIKNTGFGLSLGYRF
jgi:hypothetical protein